MKKINHVLFIGQIISLIVCLFGTMPLNTNAQSLNNEERGNLRIIYIDHEPSLPVKDVIAYIRKLRASALQNENSLIVYMPNNEDPFVSLTNVKDPSDKYDTPEAFDAICEALNQASHNKNPWYDRKRLVEMFEDYEIMDKNENLLYSAVRMEFFLTSDFWTHEYNEHIIAPLFFAIDGANLLLPDKNFNFDIYIDPNDKPQYNESAPFGDLNLGGINQLVKLDEYDFDF